LIFAQLKQRGHRGRLELLYFGGIRIDRRPSRIWIGLARCVNLAHAFTAAGVSCWPTRARSGSSCQEALAITISVSTSLCRRYLGGQTRHGPAKGNFPSTRAEHHENERAGEDLQGNPSRSRSRAESVGGSSSTRQPWSRADPMVWKPEATRHRCSVLFDCGLPNGRIPAGPRRLRGINRWSLEDVSSVLAACPAGQDHRWNWQPDGPRRGLLHAWGRHSLFRAPARELIVNSRRPDVGASRTIIAEDAAPCAFPWHATRPLPAPW